MMTSQLPFEPVQKLIDDNQAGYFDVSTDLGTTIRRQMVNALSEMGIQVEALHHEVTQGQHEIDIHYDEALKTADNVTTLKEIINIIYHTSVFYAIFMPNRLWASRVQGCTFIKA